MDWLDAIKERLEAATKVTGKAWEMWSGSGWATPEVQIFASHAPGDIAKLVERVEAAEADAKQSRGQLAAMSEIVGNLNAIDARRKEIRKRFGLDGAAGCERCAELGEEVERLKRELTTRWVSAETWPGTD